MSQRRRACFTAPLGKPSVSWSRREVLGGISASLLLASCNASRATTLLPAVKPNRDGGDGGEATPNAATEGDTARPLTPRDAGSGQIDSAEGSTTGESVDAATASEPKDAATVDEPVDTATEPVDAATVGEPVDTAMEPVDAATHEPLADAGATPQCVETEDNILGPFYREGAPERSVLTDPAFPGEALIIEGTVSGLLAGCVPLSGVLLDVWQANPMAEYDLTDSRFLFRGKLRSGADGSYRFSTVLPGRYLNGSVYRPRHIHLIASVDGYVPLTTQIYFADDPYLAVDPFVHPQLVIPLRREGDTWRGQFPIVLLPA